LPIFSYLCVRSRSPRPMILVPSIDCTFFKFRFES